MFDTLYQWILSAVAWILSWFGISMENRSVGEKMSEQDSPAVEVPSVYSMSTMEPQPMEA
jgi:hypothetical protein